MLINLNKIKYRKAKRKYFQLFEEPKYLDGINKFLTRVGLRVMKVLLIPPFGNYFSILGTPTQIYF